MKNTACSHAIVPAGCRAHVPSCANAGIATSKRIKIDLDAVSIFVGAALCGRPCLNLGERRAATEGRPYKLPDDLLRNRDAEDACEAKDRREAEPLLHFLHAVAGHHDLIAGHEINVIRRSTLVDRGDVHEDWRHDSSRLPSQYVNLAS